MTIRPEITYGWGWYESGWFGERKKLGGVRRTPPGFSRGGSANVRRMFVQPSREKPGGFVDEHSPNQPERKPIFLKKIVAEKLEGVRRFGEQSPLTFSRGGSPTNIRRTPRLFAFLYKVRRTPSEFLGDYQGGSANVRRTPPPSGPSQEG